LVINKDDVSTLPFCVNMYLNTKPKVTSYAIVQLIYNVSVATYSQRKSVKNQK